METIEIVGTGHDSPDNRDINIFKLKELPTNIPDYVLHNSTPILSQWKTGSCTIHGTSGALFESMYRDCMSLWMTYEQPYKPLDIWEIAKSKWASDKRWWYLQSAVQLVKDLGYMEWYSKAFTSWEATFDGICRIIAAWYDIATWSLFWDWKKIKVTGTYSRQTTKAWHIFCIVWYNRASRVVICKNSWWEAWWIHGWLFELKEEYIRTLYTSYVILDKSDLVYLNAIKTDIYNTGIDKIKSLWIYNGEAWFNIATDFEIATMLRRTLKTEVVTRKEISDIVYDRTVRDKSVLTIWNWLDGDKIATDSEIAKIFTRWVCRNPTANSWLLTRDKVAYVIARDFIL